MVLGFFDVWILLYLLIFFFLLELLLYKNWTPNPSFTCFMLIFINSVTSFCFSRFSESSLNWFSIHQLFPHPPPQETPFYYLLPTISFVLFCFSQRSCFSIAIKRFMVSECFFLSACSRFLWKTNFGFLEVLCFLYYSYYSVGWESVWTLF